MNADRSNAPAFASRVTLVALFVVTVALTVLVSFQRIHGHAPCNPPAPPGDDIWTAVYWARSVRLPRISLSGVVRYSEAAMCPGVRFPHVLITSNSSKPPPKPSGIAVSGVLSVGQYVLVAKEKNTATVCGLDREATTTHFRRGVGAWDCHQLAARSMRRGREKYLKHSEPHCPAQAHCRHESRTIPVSFRCLDITFLTVDLSKFQPTWHLRPTYVGRKCDLGSTCVLRCPSVGLMCHLSPT